MRQDHALGLRRSTFFFVFPRYKYQRKNICRNRHFRRTNSPAIASFSRQRRRLVLLLLYRKSFYLFNGVHFNLRMQNNGRSSLTMRALRSSSSIVSIDGGRPSWHTAPPQQTESKEQAENAHKEHRWQVARKTRMLVEFVIHVRVSLSEVE